MKRSRLISTGEIRFSPRPNRSHLIGWRPWRAASFAEAVDFDKPILLFVGTFWSERSHLMDEGTLSNFKVIKEIKRSYVPIRVDADRRPDVGSRYAPDGWPTIVLLTPDGDIITGFKLLGIDETLAILRETAGRYRCLGGEMRVEARRALRNLLSICIDRRSAPPEFKATFVDSLTSALVAGYDRTSGSFGETNNYPNPAGLDLLMRMSRRHRPDLLEMATEVLDKMHGGLYDEIEGGFFRCSTGRTWDNPTREKLLATNAGLVSTYLLAYRLTRSSRYRNAAFRTLEYVRKNLTSCATTDARHDVIGGFYSSSDSVSVLKNGPVPAEISPVDQTVITSSNCRMLNAYLDAYLVSRDRRFLDYSLSTLDLLWGNCFEPERGMARYLDEDGPHLFSYLEDQAFMILALARAGAVTGERGHLVRAVELLDIARGRLQDDSGFYDLPYDVDAPGVLVVRSRPVVANAVIARALALLSALTAEGSYLDMAVDTLGSFKLDPLLYSLDTCEFALSVHQVAAEIITTRRRAA